MPVFSSKSFTGLALIYKGQIEMSLGFPGDSVVKNLPAMQEPIPERCRFNSWDGKIPGGGHGNPLQYSCLENSVDRGTWRVIVRMVAKSWTRLKQLSMHTEVSFWWQSVKIIILYIFCGREEGTSNSSCVRNI